MVGPEIFAVLFPIMGMSIPITAIVMKHRQKIEEMRLDAGMRRSDDVLSARQDGRIEMLEDRVQVLERIITDQGYGVAAQIEALRDRSSLDGLTKERMKERR
jgi:hypothetical protein